ncbi:MAG: hypothetical protein J6U54_12645 [Clostridiales bacterium]|nr:hypothetical protein [Clostridiales bacterium]
MSKFINSRVDEKTKECIAKMTPLEKDQMYRALWFEAVVEDMNAVKGDEELTNELTDIDISKAAERFVYDCDYDCELSYYSQIQFLLEDISYDKKRKED